MATRMQHTGRTAAWAATQVPVTFVAFDLLHLDGEDLTGRPLVERKGLLDDLASGRSGLGHRTRGTPALGTACSRWPSSSTMRAS